MTQSKDYVKAEEEELYSLEERIEKMKNKWFKTSVDKQKIEFLEFYIKQKQILIDSIKDNKNEIE